MSLGSRISNLFTSNSSSSSSNDSAQQQHLGPLTGRDYDTPMDNAGAAAATKVTEAAAAGVSAPRKRKESEGRPPYLHAMMAGGLGGSTGDMLMHSLDTVKTRQQGAPTALKYATTPQAYRTIFLEEGLFRGLYSGVTPAFMGSLPGTVIFFGTYEYSKRYLIDSGCPDSLAYLAGGFIGDLFASFVYVPSEVLKTRLQLQGRHNNPHFKSGYNYRGTLDAARTIVRVEGPAALFYGYKATIMRDLPFSALQFAFYEQFRKWAKMYKGPGNDLGLALEIGTGAMAGGLAGIITCPLDVVKTRLQTQVRTTPASPPSPAATLHQQSRGFHTSAHQSTSISSPSTAPPPKQGAMKLHTSSVFTGLRLIYRTEGIAGWFRGVGPRAVWTSVQSGIMLVLYQSLLKQMARLDPGRVTDGEPV